MNQPDHHLHLGLSLVSFGLWAPIWFLLTVAWLIVGET